MPKITKGSGFPAFETFLNNLPTTFTTPPSSDFTTPTVGGKPINSYFGSNTGNGEALQLSTTQIAVEYPGASSNIYLLVHGTGLGLPSTDLNGQVNLSNATGTVTSAQLYSGGSFNAGTGTLTGGTQLASITFSASQYSVTAGASTLTVSGTDLPTTAGVVESLLGGTYSGGPLAISQIQANDNGQAITFSYSSTSISLTTGNYSVTLTGTFPASLTAAQFDALVNGSGFQASGPVGLTQIQYDDNGQDYTIALSSTALSFTAGDYILTLNGTFPNTLTAAQLDDLVNGTGNANVSGSVTGATVMQISTGAMVESATDPVAGGTSIGEFDLDFSNGGAAAVVNRLMLMAAGGSAVGSGQVAEVTSSGTYNEAQGEYLAAGQFAVVFNGGYEVVLSGGTDKSAHILSGGTQYIQGSGVASGAQIENHGVEDVGLTPNGLISGGAESINATVSSGGYVQVFGGSVVSGATVQSGGAVTLFGGVAGEFMSSTLEDGSAIYLYNQSATSVSVGNTDLLVVKSGSTIVDTLSLAGDGVNLAFTISTVNYGGKQSAEILVGAQATDDFNGDANKSDILLESTAGQVVVGELVSGQETYTGVAALGSEWTFHGNGDFKGDGKEGFLIENTQGYVYLGEVTGSSVSYTGLAAIGPEWSFEGTGDFIGSGESQFLIQNTSGQVDVGKVVGGVAQFTQVGSLGSDWKFVGTGDYLGVGTDQFLIEDTAGYVYVGEVSGSSVNYTGLSALGSEWKFVESGDFMGDGKTDYLIENTQGYVYIGEYNGNSVTYTNAGALGSEWSFVGAGDYSGTGKDSFMIEDTAGDVYTGTMVSGAVQFAKVTALGSQWKFQG